LWGGHETGRLRSYFSSFIFLQTSVVWPVLESIVVDAGWQLQVTVLAFSCFTTTQCSMISALGGGTWLRAGGGEGGVDPTGGFFAAQPARKRQKMRQAVLMPSVFARFSLFVDGELDYRPGRVNFDSALTSFNSRTIAAAL
jgi:hypothetical protein